LCIPRTIHEGDCGVIGGANDDCRGNRRTRRKPAPVPLGPPPQIPHDQVRFRTPDRSGGKPATNRLSYGAARRCVPPKRWFGFQRTTWRYIPDDGGLQISTRYISDGSQKVQSFSQTTVMSSELLYCYLLMYIVYMTEYYGHENNRFSDINRFIGFELPKVQKRMVFDMLSVCLDVRLASACWQGGLLKFGPFRPASEMKMTFF
jgi:hypothetical protein